jgi:hypothetical protein
MTDVAGMAEVSWRSWLRRFWLRLWLGNGPAGKGLIDEMKKALGDSAEIRSRTTARHHPSGTERCRVKRLHNHRS